MRATIAFVLLVSALFTLNVISHHRGSGVGCIHVIMQVPPISPGSPDPAISDPRVKAIIAKMDKELPVQTVSYNRAMW